MVCDDFFSGECATGSFNEVEVAVDFICSIDGEIYCWVVFEGGDGDTGLFHDFFGLMAGGYGLDGEWFCSYPGAECLQEVVHGASGS